MGPRVLIVEKNSTADETSRSKARKEMRTSHSGSLKCSKNILIYMSDTQSKNESHNRTHEHEVNCIIHNFNGVLFCF